MRKDKKMWKMCIDVHGVVFANSQCPGNVPIARRFPKLGNSLKPIGKQMKPERFRSWVWCPAPWHEMSAWGCVSDACAFWHFFFRSGKKTWTNLERWSISSQCRFTGFLFAGFYVWTLWTSNPSGWWEWRATRGYLWHLSCKRALPVGKNRTKSLVIFKYVY